MILSREHILFYFIFILCISLITFYYIKNYNSNIYENFYFETNNTNYLNQFNDSEISNIKLKNEINNNLNSITTILNKYSVLDPAININNTGNICDNTLLNNCKIKDPNNTTDYTCLNNGIDASCSNYFDNTIKKLINIDISSLRTRDNIILHSLQLIKNIKNQNNEIKLILDSLLDKINIKDQQKMFINYNIANLNDKKTLVNKTTEIYEKNENDININEINFKNFVSKNNNNISKINLYYKILIGIIITIIIIGVFNLFISDTT